MQAADDQLPVRQTNPPAPGRRHRRWIAALCLLAIGLAIAWVVRTSLNRDQYFFYTDEQRAQWVFQLRPVLWVVMFMLLEGAWLMYALLGPRPRALWLRCTLACLLMAPWAFTVGLWVMHAPGYFILHILWTWAISVLLFLVALVSAVLAAYRHLRQSR